jgi:aminoglycoside phosphotransferase (APT) family kinase protein
MSDSFSALIHKAEAELSRELGLPVDLVDVSVLHSPHVVLRCRVVGASAVACSVIVKQNMATEFTQPSDSGTSDRLLNEWAALRFLQETGASGRAWPSLLAASRSGSFVVIEDLGNHATVEDVLFGDSEDAATRSLVALGASLGTLHSVARHETDAFTAIQSDLGTSSPLSDSTFDIREMKHVFTDCFSVLDITPHDDFWSCVDSLETTIHSPGPFSSVIHGDAGPQNFLWDGETASMIDFEFVAVGHGLLDLVSARLGFPHSDQSYSVPMRIVDRIEASYRNAAGNAASDMSDNEAFYRGITDACAHWALTRWAPLWRRLFRDTAPDGGGSDLTATRSQAFTVYRRFLVTATEFGHFGPITETVQAYCDALQKRLPDLGETPDYPAFVSGS